MPSNSLPVSSEYFERVQRRSPKPQMSKIEIPILNPEAQENKSAQQTEALKVLEETDAWAVQ